MTAHVFVSGFVQGVGFRRFVRHHAKKLGLTGWVTNIPDNRVEAIFEGTKEQIERMIAICKKGSFLSEVKDVSVNFDDSKKHFDSFEIVG
jgi:acylphosphatase